MTMQPAPRKRELGLIHMAKAQLGLSREDYEFVISQVTRTKKTSAADLTDAERNTLLQHFKRMGFQIKPKAGAPRPLNEPVNRKMRAMWYALAEANAVVKPADPVACDKAIEAWAKRQINEGSARRELGQLDALRFATHEQMQKLIEELKQWGRRVKAAID